MVLFLCGIPASGKSSFGEYLRDNHGYFSIDMEHDWPDESLHAIWNTVFSVKRDESNVKKFVDSVTSKSRNTVLDLGFPINETYFWIIPLLERYGCHVVWFECEEDVAKKRYLDRDKRPIAWFDTQMTNIRAGWKVIEETINPIIINVLKADKSGKTDEELYLELTHVLDNLVKR